MQSSSAVSDSIRPAARADIPRVWELIQELAEYERLLHAVTGTVSDLERHAFDDHAIEIFILEHGEEVVGYTISFLSYSTFRCQPGLWLEDLYVTPAHRGRGFGRALLQNIINICQARGYGRLEWSVLDWNEPAIKFYENMGATVLPDWRICRVSQSTADSAV